MTEYIDKTEAMRRFKPFGREIPKEQVMAVIARIPTTDRPKGEWIPVSEKPKDEKKTYLVQLDGGGMCSCRWTNTNPFWTDFTTEWHWNIFDIPQYSKVVAWMDLEPYKGGEDE